MSDRIRLTVDVTHKFNQIIESLVDKLPLATCKGDVLRYGVLLMSVCIEAVSKGSKLCIIDPETGKITEILIPGIIP